ncbi:hypothetical protein JCM8097_002929 [Rhodosporidiobolus ruineniae]
MDDDDLPPLPPPLPPSHSRSFSSSSSSDAGSPRQPPFTGWSNAKSASSMRRSGSESSFTGRASATRRGARGGGHGKSASGTSSRGSNGSSNPSSPTLARAPGLSRTLSGASSSSSLSSASLSRLNSLSRIERDRASPARRTPPSSTLLTKPSPALSSSSRLSSPSAATGSSTFSVGLGPRSPSSFVAHGGADKDGDHHLRAFAKGLGGLPSPPQTAAGSDGGSTVAENGGSGRYASATVRSNGTAVSAGSGGSGDSPTKPARPPKSEARRSASLIGLSSAAAATTPPRSQQVPAIGRTSPTVAGSPAAPKRSEAMTSPRRRSELSLDLFDEEPPEDSGGADTSGSAAEAEGEETTPTKEPLASEPRRRLRARTSSAGAEEVLEVGLMGEEAERRRERRARNAEMLREKNQRILDSINAQPSPSPSSSSLASLSSPHDLRRSSTSSTIREIAAAQGSADSAWLEDNRPSSSARRRSSLDRTLRAVNGGVDEFGLASGTGTVPRSRTLGDLARDGGDGGRSTPLRARTHGYRSGGRASLSLLHRSPSALDNHDDDPPRSMTALSVRRSELVGSERTRTRAASAFGGTEGRDRAIEERFRRASREELLGGASGRERERRVSEPDLGEAELPDSPTYTRSASSLRTRAPLSLTNDLTFPSTRTPSRFSAHRPSLDLDHALERTGRSGSVEVLDSPSLYRTSSPRDRLTSPALSSLASPQTGFRDRLGTASPRVSSPLSTPDPSSSGSRTPADRDRERRRYSRSDGLPASPTATSLPRAEDELERTPRSGKKSSSGSGGSGDGGRRGVSEILEERAASRLSGEGGRRRNGFASPSSYASPPPPSSTSSRISDDLQAQRRRLESFEVGSEAWNAGFEALHRRARSRQSGSSNGNGAEGRSSLDLHSLVNGSTAAAGQTDRERDRTIRAINALLAGQGIVATAAPSALPTSPTTTSSTNSSPRKRQSFAGFDTSSSSARPRRISFADGTNADAPSAPGSGMIGRPTGRAESRVESALSMRAQGEGEHHQLLLSAFERFQQHFSPSTSSASSSSAAAAQESADLVKRMHALLLSTTKLNTGLRALTSSIQAAHVQAQLDEDDSAPPVTPAQFEKSVNALLRASDDQVRNLTEDLIAFTRVERERDRARREGELGGGASRPVSRASAYSSSASPFSPGGLTGPALHSPPKRAATSSPYEGATVSLSLAAARSPQLAREVLRNPLAGVEEDDSPSSASRRHTLSYAAQSPFAASSASPSPAGGRRESGAHARSPLAEAYETPSRRGSARSGSEGGAIGLGLPIPPRSESRLQGRRGKTSDESTVRAVSPSHSHHSHPAPSGSIRFPTSTASAQLDSTPALPNSSPTRRSTIRASPSVNGTPTTFLGREVHTDAELAAWEALQLGANLDENDADLDARLPPPPTPVRSARDSLRSASPEVGFRDRFDHQQPQLNGTGGGDSPGEGGRRKPRLSTGSLSSALKNALRPRRSTIEALNNGGAAYEPRGSFESASVASSSSPEMERERERRAERRRETENILRRTGSRS